MHDNPLNALDQALAALARADFQVGAEWAALHDICAAHEGEKPYDAVHAFCHRIEGDSWNAGYWYRRAAKPLPKGSFEEEYAGLRADIVAMQ